MSDELQSFLDSGNPEPVEVPQEPAAAEPVAAPEPTTAEQPVAPAATPEPEESWTKAMAIDERRKRQEREREIDDLRAQLQTIQQAKPAQPKPDIFEDPDGFVSQMKNDFRAETFKLRTELSQEMMRSVKPDYDEKELQFVDLAKEDPTLWQKLNASPNPAKFAYETAVKAEKLKAMENVDQYEAKIRAELEQRIRAQIEGEYAVKAEQAGKLAGIKPSLASSRSAAKDVPEPNALDMSLKELLNGR